MKTTHRFISTIILLSLVTIVSIIFFNKKKIMENNLSCTTFITVESKKIDNESMIKLMYRMIFDDNGSGISSFDGNYVDEQGKEKKLPDTLNSSIRKMVIIYL